MFFGDNASFPFCISIYCGYRILAKIEHSASIVQTTSAQAVKCFKKSLVIVCKSSLGKGTKATFIKSITG